MSVQSVVTIVLAKRIEEALVYATFGHTANTLITETLRMPSKIEYDQEMTQSKTADKLKTL